MFIRKTLGRFKRKLLAEAIGSSLPFAITGGAAVVWIVSLIVHIMMRPFALTSALAIGGGVFALIFLTLFILRFPTQKKVAARMDALGLQERVSTMLAYQHDDSEIAKLQRRDALEHIRAVSAKEMPLRLYKPMWIAATVCLALAAGTMMLPTDILLRLFPPTVIESAVEEPEQDNEIALLIEELRENVRQSRLEDELKKELSAIIDELEEDLQYADNELEQAIQIEQAKQEMQQLLEEQITKMAIGAALQQYPLTAALGEAVGSGDTEGVKTALDELEAMLAQDPTMISTLSETIQNALDDSGSDSSDKLYGAFLSFYKLLDVIDTDSDDFEKTLTFTFDESEKAILFALEIQNSIQSELENFEDLFGGEDETTDEQEQAPPPPPPSGSQNGEEGILGDGEQPNTMTEEIFDPVSGSVSYGDVFATYYADYLKALENGDIPEEMQEILDRYYTSLS
ncbi:MAG: hypothetical protein IKV35_03405 [Clostridia bacterium]|nr:hypothetical protein [Clostridia bacterium]